jgi:hypothetical protein
MNLQRRSEGQALVEFSLVIVLFLVLMMAVVDLGRGIYIFNGVSQAAREIARTTSVHPGSPLGSSPETADTLAIQQRLIPGLDIGGDQDPDGFDCVDYEDNVISGTFCRVGSRAKVTVSAPFEPLFGLLSSFGTFEFSSSSSIEISDL